MLKHLKLWRVIYVTILIAILSSFLSVLWINLFHMIPEPRVGTRGERGATGAAGRDGTNGRDAIVSWPDGSRSSITLMECPSGVMVSYEVYIERGVCP
jgi:hypothetical protein